MVGKNNNFEKFYSDGHVVFDGLKTVEVAKQTLETFIHSLDGERLPLYGRLRQRISFLKRSAMPIADDVQNAFQGLHFDMGHPFIRKSIPTLYLLVALYLPPTTAVSDGKTRVIKTVGLLCDKKWKGRSHVEKKLMTYARYFGDGWSSQKLGNTGRICCFAKVLDALGEKRKLPDYIDWFYDTSIDDESSNRKMELQFYRDHGIDLKPLEQQIPLLPGQMLLIDNTRMIHSRFGKRKEKEMWQFLYGVSEVKAGDVPFLRRYVVSQLTRGSGYGN